MVFPRTALVVMIVENRRCHKFAPSLRLSIGLLSVMGDFATGSGDLFWAAVPTFNAVPDRLIAGIVFAVSRLFVETEMNSPRVESNFGIF